MCECVRVSVQTHSVQCWQDGGASSGESLGPVDSQPEDRECAVGSGVGEGVALLTGKERLDRI